MQSWSPPAVPQLAGAPPALRLYDTSARQVLPVAPGKTATMYVCGITPTTRPTSATPPPTSPSTSSTGCCATPDTRSSTSQNVTDVDDPLFERAQRDGVDWRDLGAREIALFRDDMAGLRVLPPRSTWAPWNLSARSSRWSGAYSRSGAACIVDDAEYPDVYYRIDATEQFGYESGYDRPTMEMFFAQRGGDPDRPGKRDRLDALLWRARRDGEPSWPAPFGDGRPGWHIECSAIALNRLGAGFDIQGGGNDLIFPHHEFSAAHAEALTGVRRFARHYVHTGMMGLDGRRCPRAWATWCSVHKLREAGVDPGAVRLALGAQHYRADRMWTDAVLEEAVARLNRWRAAVATGTGPDAAPVIERVRAHLADDLDTPKALAAIDGWVADVELGLGSDSSGAADVVAAVDALLGVDLR